MKKPEDRCAHASISMSQPHWAALDVMRGLTPRATYLADIVKRRWHAHLDSHSDLVEHYRREHPAMLIGYSHLEQATIRDALNTLAKRHQGIAQE